MIATLKVFFFYQSLTTVKTGPIYNGNRNLFQWYDCSDRHGISSKKASFPLFSSTKCKLQFDLHAFELYVRLARS